MNDFTLRFKNGFYQLHETQAVTVCRRDAVIVEERLDGTVHLRHQRRGKYLAYTILPERPIRVIKTPVLTTTTGASKAHTPALNHPWRSALLRKNRENSQNTKPLSLNSVNPG